MFLQAMAELASTPSRRKRREAAPKLRYPNAKLDKDSNLSSQQWVGRSTVAADNASSARSDARRNRAIRASRLC